MLLLAALVGAAVIVADGKHGIDKPRFGRRPGAPEGDCEYHALRNYAADNYLTVGAVLFGIGMIGFSAGGT